MQRLNDRQPYAFDKFDESNEHSHSKLSDVDHEVPNEPEQALYPTSNAWLKLNAHLKLYNFSYLSILTVERFFNLNSKSFGKISAQPHTTLCIQFLDRENNDKSNRLPLGGNFTEFFVRTKNIPKSIHVISFFLL